MVVEKIVNEENISFDVLHFPGLREKNIWADILRLDKIHPIISGNKWFKLKYYLQEAVDQKKMIITFGGAYSNHLLATACAGRAFELQTAGFVRGEEPGLWSHTLMMAREFGMNLTFITRNEYLKRDNEYFIKDIHATYPDAIIIPEGGSGMNGIRGSSEILRLIKDNEYTHYLCAVGTGTTFCGLAHALSPGQQIIGISVLKDNTAPSGKTNNILPGAETMQNCFINRNYHFGGYAKKNIELISFMNTLYSTSGVPTDFVYTGKLFYAAVDLIKKDFFPQKSRILIIHSGGLQGNDSLPAGTLNFS
jgi:1-aminocyclopropane-1-carboxylate deaminase